MKSLNFQTWGMAIIVLFTLSSCAQFSGFQTAKTAGKGGGEMYFAVAGLTTQTDIEIDVDTVQSSGSVAVTVPVVELGGRFGVAERVDIGLRFSTSLTVLIDAKLQLLGDQDSKFAAAVGGGFGYQGLGIFGLWQGHVPVFFSYHPTPKVAIYLAPRYVGLFGSDIDGAINYGNFSTGIELGEKIKFALDFSFSRILNDQEVFDLLTFWQIGTGIKFAFGG